jgi:heme-degrading monooxygenase HmoA
MRFLLFDVKPWADAMNQYLDIAAALRPELDASGGCEFIDRFKRIVQQPKDEGWMLSFQFWRDEESLVRWRKHAIHHEAQQTGRDTVFEDYHLRVGEVVRSHSSASVVTPLCEPSPNAQLVVLIESKSDVFDSSSAANARRFESIYRPGRFLHVLDTDRYDAALDLFEHARASEQVSHASIGSVDRDYGMFERMQAPQAFSPR